MPLSAIRCFWARVRITGVTEDGELEAAASTAAGDAAEAMLGDALVAPLPFPLRFRFSRLLRENAGTPKEGKEGKGRVWERVRCACAAEVEAWAAGDEAEDDDAVDDEEADEEDDAEGDGAALATHGDATAACL